ncbi:transposable element Tc3 transposase [Trichonephila clavipes]|nr:transposable element Tc3 transposase [Trichonephila clavipes]
MYYSIDMNFFYSKDNLVALHFKYDQARRKFVEWAQNEIVVVSDFHKQILFSDEAHFLLNGYVNKQNCRIWSEANPQVYVETPLHPEKLTVWCALWAGGIIGPYFFKNDEGHNATVNGDRYRAVVTNCFIPELNNQDVQELWFQQDGATCHTARATIDLLKDTFGDRLISRFGPVNWPPRSCDLTPLDYFLWDYVKSLVCVDKPQTLDHWEDNIRRVIADIRPQMLEKVIENWTSRLDYIRASRGSHMSEIIFKITCVGCSEETPPGNTHHLKQIVIKKRTSKTVGLSGLKRGCSKGRKVAAMVKITDTLLVLREFKPCTTEYRPCRGGRCTLKMSRLKRPPVGVVFKLGEGGFQLRCRLRDLVQKDEFRRQSPSCSFVARP